MGVSFLRTLTILEEGISQGQHLGVQLYVSRHGRVLTDLALGEAREGVAMRTDTVNVWFSSGKPLTAVAVGRLWESGGLELDRAVRHWIPEFGEGGKEGITVRHLLNHTAGFRGADRVPHHLPWEDSVRAIAATAAEPDWVPGRRAGYQLFSSWSILGELVRRIDGRSIDRYVAEEVFGPLGMGDCWVALPRERFAGYGDRVGCMHFATQGRMRPHPVWNEPSMAAVVRPGGSVRGPIRSLGAFYEGLMAWGEGRREGLLLRPETRREMTSPSRGGLFDETFRHHLEWGLGFGVNCNRYGVETVPYGFGRHASDGAFGHGGSQSSVGFADPAYELVVAWVCNGMIGEDGHQSRARRINAAIYEDLGLARE